MDDKNRFSWSKILIVIIAVLVTGSSGFIWKNITTTSSTLTSNETPEVNKMKEKLSFNVNTGPSIPQMQSANEILEGYQKKLRSENEPDKRKQTINEIKLIFEGYTQANIPNTDMALFLKDIQNGNIN